HQDRATRAGVVIPAAIGIRRSKWYARLPLPDAGQLPSADQHVHRARRIVQELSLLSERQRVHLVEIEYEAPDTVLAAVIDVVVPQEIVIRVIESAGPREVSLEHQAAGETFFAAHLKGVELDAGVVCEILDGLRPAELLEEKAPLIRAQHAEA